MELNCSESLDWSNYCL